MKTFYLISIIQLKHTFTSLHFVNGVISLTQILKCGHQLFSTTLSLGLVHIYSPQSCFQNEKQILLSTTYMRLDSPYHPYLSFFLSLYSPPVFGVHP